MHCWHQHHVPRQAPACATFWTWPRNCRDITLSGPAWLSAQPLLQHGARVLCCQKTNPSRVPRPWGCCLFPSAHLLHPCESGATQSLIDEGKQAFGLDPAFVFCQRQRCRASCRVLVDRDTLDGTRHERRPYATACMHASAGTRADHRSRDAMRQLLRCRNGARHNGHWCFVTVGLVRERFRAIPRGAPNSGTCRALLRDGGGEVDCHWPLGPNVGRMRFSFAASHEQRRAAVACACTACVFDCRDQLVTEASPAVCWLRPNGSRDKPDGRSSRLKAISTCPIACLQLRKPDLAFPPVRALMSTVWPASEAKLERLSSGWKGLHSLRKHPGRTRTP